MSKPTVVPPMLPDSDEPFVDDAYSESELEGMDRNELQQLAAAHPHDGVNGQDSNAAIIDGLTGRKRIET